MSYFFIINPGSNHYKEKQFFKVIETVLNKRNITFEYKFTSIIEDAYFFSKEANEKGYEVIVAVGGDGTINKVINGFYDEKGKRISQTKLGVIHTGTSPDFCKSYGIPNQPLLALETLLNNYSVEISVVQIDFRTKNQRRKTGYFVCCASIGLGAKVAENANSGIRKYLGDTLGTFVSILKSLINYKPSDMKIICDEKERVIVRNFNTFIGKTTFVASGIKVNHQLSIDDNRLYLLCLKKINFRNVLPALRAIYSGKPICNKDYISYEYIESIEIMNDEINNEIEFDGDPQGFLPCKISVAIDKLEVITNEL